MSGKSQANSESQGSHPVQEILSARRQVEDARARGASSSPSRRDGVAVSPDSIPGYTLLGEVHRGGQGVVYEARQESTRRRVAIKIMHQRPVGSDAGMRFERETHVLAQLKHPNIVTIHDSGSAAGGAYYVMDYVSGEPLDRYVRRVRPGVEESLRLFGTICDAVHEAHVRGIIHRDLKPSNVLVNERGEPRVLDFGLAKLAEGDEATPAVTATGQFIGSLPWSAPEQVAGRSGEVDTRTDVYSLGVMLYQVVTGRFPYDVTGSTHDVMNRIVHAEPVRPGGVHRAIDDELDTIVLRCLHKERARRYDNAGHLGRDLRHYLAKEPIEAKRDSGWYVFKKTLRRHRVPVAFGVLVLAFGIVALAGLAIAHRRESDLRAEAQRQAAIAQAVNRFLNQDLLAAVKPQEKGREVTVREVLDAASKQIDAEFPDEPVIEAAVRATLGNTYMELGEWKAALGHAERALELSRAHRGAEHPDTLSAMQLVGRLYRRLGRYSEARSILQGMVDSARATLGPEHPLSTQGMNNLAYALAEVGLRREALALNREALDIRTRTLGAEHADTLKSLHNQGYYVEILGHYAEAERLYARAYRLREKVLGPDHPDTLFSMGNLANMWAALGRLDDAQRLHVARLGRAKALLGERHPMVLRSLCKLGDVYRRQEYYEEAERALLEALAAWREVVGNSHREVAAVLWRLGELYAGQERFDDAEDSLVRAVRMYRNTVGINNAETLGATLALEELYVERGQYERAESLLLEAADELQDGLGTRQDLFPLVHTELNHLYEAWDAAEPGKGHAAEAAKWRNGTP